MLNAEFGMLNDRRRNGLSGMLNGRGGNDRVHVVPLVHRGRFKRQALFEGCPQQVAGFFLSAQQVEVANVLAAGIYVPADFDTK